MNIILFGASGMVGQGVLRECLLAADVDRILIIGRSPCGVADSKITEIRRSDLFDYSDIESQLKGFDACFFTLGVSSAGMKEPDYERITYGITLAAAKVLARLNPAMTFLYISGQGTDSTESGSTMWARIKGKTENALLRLPFGHACMLRPGFIQPLHGIRSKTPAYRVLYAALTPFMPLLRKLFPNQVLTTEDIGKAMLALARSPSPRKVLEPPDIRALLDQRS